MLVYIYYFVMIFMISFHLIKLLFWYAYNITLTLQGRIQDFKLGGGRT